MYIYIYIYTHTHMHTHVSRWTRSGCGACLAGAEESVIMLSLATMHFCMVQRTSLEKEVPLWESQAGDIPQSCPP